ncbi:hypothetical protein MNBD_ALPHA11-2184 [hydrothermal vent metagenome]|uniref:Uncharacterized protein n=1 Tax=hydrothermal vent metagenome TaxID=652676 RepID=A0A3B0U235_9ZZZZ
MIFIQSEIIIKTQQFYGPALTKSDRPTPKTPIIDQRLRSGINPDF